MTPSRPLGPNPNVEGVDSVAEFKRRKSKADTIWFVHFAIATIGLIIATTGSPSDRRERFGVGLFIVSGLSGVFRSAKHRRCPVCERVVFPRRNSRTTHCANCGAQLAE